MVTHARRCGRPGRFASEIGQDGVEEAVAGDIRGAVRRVRPRHISDVKLRLEGVPGEASLFLTFTHRDRPGCQFSYTWPLHGWNDDDDPGEEVPDNQVTLLWANLTENLCALGYGLPTNCRPGEVVELGRPRMELELELASGRVLEGYADRFDVSVVELRDKLIEAARPITQQHVRELNEIMSAAFVRSRQQQKDGPDTPLDP